MPKKLEQKLKAEAKKKGLKGKQANAYTYGTMKKMMTPSTHKAIVPPMTGMYE